MRKLIITGCLLYAGAFAALVLFQSVFIYPFDPTETSPSAAGEPRLKAVNIKTSDGTRLVVWVARPKSTKPLVLYFHGNAGNLATRAQRFDRLLDRGYGVVALGYRGSSGSGGQPDEQSLYRDAMLVRQSLGELLGRVPAKIIYYGESLGTAVATGLALKVPPNGLILEAPFTSLDDLVAEKLGMFPTSLGLTQHWPTLERISLLRTPLLVMHGAMDKTVPVHHGQTVFDASPSAQKWMRRVQDIGHTGHWSVDGQRAIYKFIDGL